MQESPQKEKKKVFFVTNNARMMLVFRREMLEAFTAIYEVTIVSPKDADSEKTFSEIGCRFIPCEVDRRGTNPIKDVKLIIRYWRIFKKEKPDAIVSFTIKPNIYAGFAARALSIPFIATVEGLGSGWKDAGILSKFVQRLYAAGLKGAKIVFVLNQYIFDELARVGVKKEKMKFLPGMGVNLRYFTAVPYPKDEDTLRLLTIGRVMREKGFPELIGVAHRLEKELPNLVWHVVGAPEVKEADLLGKLKACKNVIYHGPKSDVRPYYAMCHATTTTTTYHEGISTVCLEAAGSARPVLGTNEFGVKETFIEGVTGFGIKKGDVADTVRVIKNFFTLTNSERAAMGGKAREYAEEKFDRNKVTWSYFTVLMSVYAKESPENLDVALQSIAASTKLPSEVILVKDGALPEALERVIAKWQRGGKLKLVVVGYEANRGLAAALAFGLKFVKTELVARMDSDDVCARDRFEKQLRFMEENPDVAVSSGYIEEFLDKPGMTVSVRRVPLTSEAVHEYLKSRCPFNHMAVMYRKSAVLAAGSYQEVPFFEDYDLWFRMDAMEFKGANLPDTLVYARIGNDMIGRRHGLSYAKCELNFLKRQREKGFLSATEYAKTVLLRVPVRLLPKTVLAWVYKVVRMA